MVFRKPYAFFIKHFRLINMFIVILFCYLAYKLNLIRDVVNSIYLGSVTNYSALNSTYLGFNIYLLIFLIILGLAIVILLLKRKKKPLNDYLFSLVYVIIVLIYLLFMSNVFFTLEEKIIEQTSLKLYSDISLLIIVPIIYFVFKFILIVIGFNLSKFNFTQDILELKQEDKDNEEIELIFDKNSYKYKRNIRKIMREFKYYVLENKFLISIILGVLILLSCITLFSVNMFKTNKVNKNENFVAAGFNYKITNITETIYDLNCNIIKDDSKFVVISVDVRNNNNIASSIDFKRIRLVYGNEYVYANNYYNKFFYDLGQPYNSEPLIPRELYKYTFIFKVPNSYKNSKYTLKFYDRVVLEDEEIVGSYKEIKLNADKVDKKRDEKILSLNENTVFNKKRYGNSNLTLFNYDIKNNYIFNNGEKIEVIRDKNINKKLLILDYKLDLDNNYAISNYFSTDLDFFDKFVSLTYNYNGKDKEYTDVKAMGNVDGKVMLSVPYEVQDATKISVILNFRDVKIVYNLK